MKKIILSLLIASMVLSSTATIVNAEKVISIENTIAISNEGIENKYQELIKNNPNQIQKEQIKTQSRIATPTPENADEFLRQNYNLLYQIVKEKPNFKSVAENMNNGVYQQIQYEDNTKSYIMVTVDTNSDIISMTINEDEYAIKEENDNIVMTLNDTSDLILQDQVSKLIQGVENLSTQKESRAAWIEFDYNEYYTNSWVIILDAFTNVIGLMEIIADCKILGTITLITGAIVEIGDKYLVHYYVKETEYCKNDCVLYRLIEQSYYDEGSGTGNLYHVKDKSFTYWTQEPSGSGCMQYPYPGY